MANGTKKADAAKAPKTKRFNRVVKSKDGKEQIRFTAQAAPGKAPVSFGFHSVLGTNDKGKTTRAPGKGRGASQEHKSFEDAVAAVEAAVKQAVASGRFVAPTRGGGGGAPVDKWDLGSLLKA